MGSSSTKWTLKLFAKNFLCVFLGELQFLFLQKNLKSVQNICEATLEKILRLFSHYGIVEKRSRDCINENYDMLQKSWKYKDETYLDNLSM